MGFISGYYLPKDRATRITQLLDPKSNWDKESVSKMMIDNTSFVALEVISNLISNLDGTSLSKNEVAAVSVLKAWKGTNNLNDVAPTIYNKWIYLYLKHFSRRT
jgi:penicillin amidase